MDKLNKSIQAQFDLMCKSGKLFRVEMTGREVWDLYLRSFSKEDDPIFRDPESSVHNCNHCKNFVRRYGNIVSIDKNFKTTTIFDVVIDGEFENTVKELSKTIQASEIKEVFFETFNELNSLPYESCSKKNKVFRLGVDKNVKRYTKAEAELFGVVKPNQLITFRHLHLDLPKAFVDLSGSSVEEIMAKYRDKYSVFRRGIEEIPVDTLGLVIDLIKQGSLLDGDSHLYAIEAMLKYKTEYAKIDPTVITNWFWVTSYLMEERVAKFKNTLVGTLCSELAEGEEINKACQSWNKRVDPANYMKAVAPITEAQKKMAQKFIEENGYLESFDRRIAVLDDIKVDEIKHINIGDGKIKEASIFDKVKTGAPSRHKRNEFKGVEEVSIEKFMSDILPGCTSVEAYLENSHENNMVTMTTSNDLDSKQIFKWNNPFSWTYKGNLAGKSMIKQAVKDQGGNIDGVLNFRLAWNDDGGDRSDLDAWAQEPGSNTIGFSTKFRKDKSNVRTPMSGQLDLDNTDPGTKMGVENITWTDLSKMKNGKYKLWVNQYSARNSKGFKAEIEFNGEIYEYSYNQPVKGNVTVAEVTVKDGEMSIKHIIPSSTTSKEIYGLETKQFHKVDLVCLSPNHWGVNNVGNKHYFFMIDECKTDSGVRSFHSENLTPEISKHRKVLEVLGAVNMLEPTDKQLSGLGFNATVKDEIFLRLQGNFKRVIKVLF